MNTYKISAKLGSAEFSAEGAEESVRADYDRFLAALRERTAGAEVDSGPNGGIAASATDSVGVDASILQAVFKVDEERSLVSLRVLPTGDSAERAAEAALLILYGFHTLLGNTEAPVTKLLASLRESGITVERFDRTIGRHSDLILKGGQKIGARYRLNNLGMAHAAKALRALFR
jgi:hypothetical protein